MGRISVYDTLTAEHTNYNANGKLKDIFPEINFKHSLVLKAGNRIDENYEVQPDDVLYVRKVPGAVTTIAIVAVAVAVVAVGVGVGATVYANKKSEEARKEMEKAQRNAQNQAQQAQQLPFIRGAKNKNALGNPVQFVMGSVYNTPYNLTNGFYSIDGTDGVNSYYNAVFSAGYGSQKVTDILIGNETLVSDQSGISGEVDFDSEVYEGRAEVRQPGQDMTLTNCNYKVSSTYSGAELKHDFGQDAVPVTVQAASNAYKIQVCIAFSCLRSYDSENEVWTERTAVVRPYWSNDGGQSWNEFTFEGSTNNTFTKNSNKTIRFVATKNFTAQESYGKDILIKVVKETPKAESGTQEDCSLLWYQTFCYDAALSSANTLEPCYVVEDQLKDKITRVAYRIIANDSTKNMLDELHVYSQGLARTWSNNAWSQTKTPTRNVADWILEVLTTDIHEPSKFDDDEIYLPSFGALHDYCATNEFYCDGIVSGSIKKKDLIEKLLTICNSTLIINADGLLEVCTDKEETNPVALLNSENIISMTWSKSLARKLDGKKVTFTNRDSWTVDTFYSMLDGGSYDYATDQVDSLALDYVTTYNHAYKLAQRKLREIQLMPQTMEVDVGSEGDFYPLYSTVLMQLPQLLQGLRSSVIKHVYYNTSNQITKIDISDAVDFVSGSRYGVVIQATNDYGFKLISAEVTGTEKTRTLTFSAPLTPDQSGIVPTLGNHLSFGLLDENGGFTKVTHTMKIYGIKPNDKSGYVLTLRNYDPDVYSYGGPIPAYVSNVTKPQKRDRDISLEDMIKLQNSVNAQLTNFFTNIYANHIVTLYKYSETDLPSTGIGTTLVYDFSTDTITWGDPSLNNGWSLDAPSDLTDVWVTSATAHGQAQTDTINSNEWARPIKVGQNGVNGLNTCTINLYKRLSTTPQDLPATVTYNFANASMVCSNWNGWSTSIPEVDDEDFTPCWEIHATALSTQTTDTIESSEWSECAKILSEGLSKQDVLDLIGERINETPNVLFTPSEGMFAVDEDGIVSTPQTAFMDIRVIQNDEDIAFSFGQITLPTGMSVSATELEHGTRLNFTVAQGTRLERNVIKVPVIFTAYADNDLLVDENGNPLVWVEDEDGRWYGDCSSVASLPVAVSGGFIYWNGIDTTASEELVEGGVFYEGIFYTYNGTKWKESKVKPIGIQTEATSPTTYDVYYTASIVKGGRYDGGITTVASIPANPVIGDYFTWTGADQTPYEGSGFNKLNSGCVYKWNGTAWEKDTSGKHLGTALPDILEVAESELVENNSDVVEKVGKMIAWDVVTQNIKVTGEALINSAIIADLTLGDSTHQTSGEIKSYNYSSGSAGFRIKADGTAEFNSVTVRGDVQATSLTTGLTTSLNQTAQGYANTAESNAVNTTKSWVNQQGFASASALNNYALKTQTSKVTIGSPSVDSETGITSKTITVTDANTGSSSEYKVQESDDFMTFAHAKSDELTLLTSQPSNWSTTYKQYFRKDDDNDNYESLASLNSAPAWATNTYYSAEGKKFYSVDKNGLLVASNAVIWGTIYATNGQFTGDVVANSFTLGANATIEKGTDEEGESYFGLSSDGTLKVRNINAIDGNFAGSIRNSSLSIEKITSSAFQLFRKEKVNMTYGEVVGLFTSIFDMNTENNETLTDKYFYFYKEGIISDDCDKFSLSFRHTDPTLVVDPEPAYCQLKVHKKRQDQWVDIINMGTPEEDYSGWEREILAGLSMFALYSIVSDIAKIKCGVLPKENPMEEGEVYDDNGFIKISGKNQPWKYFEFPSGTDVRYVFDSIRPWLSNPYEVSCLGYYGTSDSSHDRNISTISAVGGNLNFKNHNDTNYLSIPSTRRYGENYLQGKLAVLFLSV